MYKNPDNNEDFISSAGVPTIPLQFQKRRSYHDVIAYVVFVVLVLVGMLVQYGVILKALAFITSPYDIALLLVGISGLVLGIIIKQNIVLFAGAIDTSFGIGLLFMTETAGASFVFSLMVALLVYYRYRNISVQVKTYWPFVIAAILGIAGVLILANQSGLIPGGIIPPVLMIITGGIIVWELRRKK